MFSRVTSAFKKCVTCTTQTNSVHIKLEEAVPADQGINEDNQEEDFPGPDHDFEDPAGLLTVYMILIHEQEMAKVLWEYSGTGLFLSLVCTQLHKWMSNHKADSIFISDALADKLKKDAKEFEDISCEFLEQVSRYKDYVIAYVNYRFEDWGGRTILEMADYVNVMGIIAHPTIQDYIDLDWNGCLDSEMSLPRTIVSLCCPLLASYRDFTPMDRLTQMNAKSSKYRRNRLQAFVARGVNKEETLQNKTLSPIKRCLKFYQAPRVKFWIYTLEYAAFLFSYICALLLKEKGTVHECGPFRRILNCRLTLSQQLVYCLAFCLIALEIRQVYFSYPTTLLGKLKMYFHNFYNKSDAMCLFTILLALVFKFMNDFDDPYYKTSYNENMFRLLFAMAFVLFCVKLCQSLEKSEKIGPKVMMMTKMLKDLKFFFALIFIFVIAYGVSTASIMNPQKFDNFKSSTDIVSLRHFSLGKNLLLPKYSHMIYTTGDF